MLSFFYILQWKKKLRKIRIIFDVENWLWKSDNWQFSITWFRAGVDLPENLFNEKVLFFTQSNCHLMCRLLKKPYMSSSVQKTHEEYRAIFCVLLKSSNFKGTILIFFCLLDDFLLFTVIKNNLYVPWTFSWGDGHFSKGSEWIRNALFGGSWIGPDEPLIQIRRHLHLFWHYK